MRFSLIALSSVSFAAAQLCPGANNLLYQAGSGKLYQVRCSIEYWTQTNLASSKLGGPLACADACDKWTTGNQAKPCAAGSFENSTSVCYLKPGDLNAEKRGNNNVISLILTPVV